MTLFFQKRFVDKILAGEKTTTIRTYPARLHTAKALSGKVVLDLEITGCEEIFLANLPSDLYTKEGFDSHEEMIEYIINYIREKPNKKLYLISFKHLC